MDSKNISSPSFFKIRPSLKNDVDKIKELSGKVFGVGYLDSWFAQDTGLKDPICLVASRDTNIIGMVYFSKIEGFLRGGRFLQCIMVDDRYRRKGIASCLYNKALQILTEENTRRLHASCWKESPHPGIIPFLQRKGWKTYDIEEKYWHADSIKAGYQCTRCGQPCFCTAVLMSITL